MLLKNGSSDATPSPEDQSTPPPEVPAFSFKVAKADVVPTNDTSAKKLSNQAQATAKSVGETLSDMYRWAYLAPANWQSGSYDQVWNYYDSHSVSDAKSNVDTLTLGSQAGDTFSSVEPGSGNVQVQVLMDDHNKPTSALATVKFSAKAAGKDGSTTVVNSTGDYFLRPAGSKWVIYSFKVSRKDHSKKSAPASIGGGSPSAKPTETP